MPTILITGGSGFIGSHLAEHFHGHAQVRIFDNMRSGHRKNLAGLNVDFIDGSITDRCSLGRAMRGVDYVFHLAALVSVPESVSKPHECVEINVCGHLNVLEVAANAGVRKVIFASSAAIYGDNPTVPKMEAMLPEPRSPYAITKLDGEYYNDLFTRLGRLEAVSARFFNVFGPRQDPRGPYAAAVPIFIEKALAGGRIDIYGDGEQTRDFVYVKDIVSALVFAMQPGLTGVFNVGYGRSLSINYLAKRIIALTNSSSVLQYLGERAGDVKHSLASPTRIHMAGWRPTHSFEDGLVATVNYFRNMC